MGFMLLLSANQIADIFCVNNKLSNDQFQSTTLSSRMQSGEIEIILVEKPFAGQALSLYLYFYIRYMLRYRVKKSMKNEKTLFTRTVFAPKIILQVM